MKRRLSPPLAACLMAALLLGGCDVFSGISSGRDPAVQSIPVSPRDGVRGTGYAGSGGVVQPNARAPGGDAARDQVAVQEACQRDIDRVISTRDRGQLMREDEAGNRQGASTMAFSPSSLSMQNEQAGRRFERGRLVQQCVEQNNRAAPAAPR